MKKKKLILRIVMLALAAAMIVGIIISAVTPMMTLAAVNDNAASVVIDNFITGSIDKSISEKAPDKKIENIISIKVAAGILNSKDFETLASLSECKFYDLKSAEAENGDIPDYIFNNHKSIERIYLPENTAQIGRLSFADCSNLKKVEYLKNTQKLQHGAFKNCTELISIEFSEKLENIGESAFYGCKKLEYCFQKDSEFIISDNLNVINKSAFSECTSIKKIIFNENIERIAQSAFMDCFSLKNIEFMGAVAPILGADAFPTDTYILYPENSKGYDKWITYNVKENKSAETSVEVGVMMTPQEDPDITDNRLTGTTAETTEITVETNETEPSLTVTQAETVQTMVSETSADLPTSGTIAKIPLYKIVITIIICVIGIIIISQFLLKCFDKIDKK